MHRTCCGCYYQNFALLSYNFCLFISLVHSIIEQTYIGMFVIAQGYSGHTSLTYMYSVNRASPYIQYNNRTLYTYMYCTLFYLLECTACRNITYLL